MNGFEGRQNVTGAEPRQFFKISSSSSFNLCEDRLVTVSLCVKGSALFLVRFFSFLQ